MLRIRQIVDPLVPRAQQIIDDGLLPPNIEGLFNSNKVVKYPPFVYTLQKKHKWAFSHFGIFIEYLLRKMLNGDWKEDLYELYISLTKHFTHDDISKLVTKDDLYGVMGRFVNISKYITAEFSDKVLYDQELSYNPIVGHPDFLTENGVYDVKTVTKFNTPSTKHQAILQISAYLALARASGRNPTVIGIILPFQQITLDYTFEYTEYDHQPFWSLTAFRSGPRRVGLKTHPF